MSSNGRAARVKEDRTLTPSAVRVFRKKIYDHFKNHGRDLPWRKRVDSYRVLISEIMLQQTQVERVLGKYREFLAAFPDFTSLAQAPLSRLLAVWSGMGYNRRALALKALARKVVHEHHGKLPSDPEELIKLPGIGKYTAGAVCAFAFNKPVVFLDTNIRRVFIHEFFHDRENIRDDEILSFIERTLDRENPSKWYNALMDYGAGLKKEHGNPNRRSAHYARQGPFENSNRRVRGAILKLLVREPALNAAQIVEKTGMDAERVKNNLTQLAREGFITRKGRTFFVS